MVVVPANYVESVILQAAELGTRHVLVISAGFKEIGGDGVERENRIKQIARENGMSIVGPNCLGIINTDPEVSMNATFGRDIPPHGCLGLISQSGALVCRPVGLRQRTRDWVLAVCQFWQQVRRGRSRLAAFDRGRRQDACHHDVRRGCRQRAAVPGGGSRSDARPQSQAGAGDQERSDGRRCGGGGVAHRFAGRFRQSLQRLDDPVGCFRVETVAQLFDLAEIFTDPTLPRGKKTAIITNAGGPGIMATDACIRHGLELAKFRDYTKKSLQFQMPMVGSIKNPVDVIGDARHDRYRAALDAVSADDQVDQVLVIVTPQTMTDVTEIAEVIGETKEFCNKPMAACLMGLTDVSSGVEILQRKYGVPTFAFPENAMRALAAKSRFGQWVRSEIQGSKQFEVDKEGVTELFERELAEGRPNLIELKALEALGDVRIPHRALQAGHQRRRGGGGGRGDGVPGGHEDLRPQDPAQDGCRRREVEPGRRSAGAQPLTTR